MTRLGFLIARATGNEARLARLSPAIGAVLAELDGKRVALVGNARSLLDRTEGVQIDEADVVMRLNGSPLPSAVSHGTRTDWILTSTPLDAGLVASRMPRRILWMTPRRKALPWRLASDPRFALLPADWNARLRDELRARPTTGLMAIDVLARSPAREVRLHGFDFFASLSLSGGRTAAQVPHDFAAERAWVERLAARDRRFSL